MPDFRFLSSASVLAPHYSASVSSFPFFLFSPLSGFSSASVLPFGFPVFHLLFRLVSHASFPVFGTRLSVCFLSSFPASLPQPFHRCFPSFLLSFVCFSSGLSACFPFSFVHFCLLLTTQPSALSFPFFPFSPGSGSSGAFFPLPSDLFPCLPSDSGTQLSAFPFSVFCFASQWLPQLLSPLPFGFRPLPLGFRFRFWLLGIGIYLLRDTFRPLRFLRANFFIISQQKQNVNTYF